MTLPAPFTDVERHQVEWTSYLTPQALIDLVASRSYCITSPAEVRTRTLDQVRELLATHPALANTTGLALPYVTVCIRATLTLTLVSRAEPAPQRVVQVVPVSVVEIVGRPGDVPVRAGSAGAAGRFSHGARHHVHPGVGARRGHRCRSSSTGRAACSMSATRRPSSRVRSGTSRPDSGWSSPTS